MAIAVLESWAEMLVVLRGCGRFAASDSPVIHNLSLI
jgi:hypothetical protein